jgi:CHAT domain-containing protein
MERRLWLMVLPIVFLIGGSVYLMIEPEKTPEPENLPAPEEPKEAPIVKKAGPQIEASSIGRVELPKFKQPDPTKKQYFSSDVQKEWKPYPLPDSFRTDGLEFLDTKSVFFDGRSSAAPAQEKMNEIVAGLNKNPQDKEMLAKAAALLFPPHNLPYLIRYRAAGGRLTERMYHHLVTGLAHIARFEDADKELKTFEVLFPGFKAVAAARTELYARYGHYALEFDHDLLTGLQAEAARDYRIHSSVDANGLDFYYEFERQIKSGQITSVLPQLDPYWVFCNGAQLASSIKMLRDASLPVSQALRDASSTFNNLKDCPVEALLRRCRNWNPIQNFTLPGERNLSSSSIEIAQRAWDVAKAHPDDRLSMFKALINLAEISLEHGNLRAAVFTSKSVDDIAAELGQAGLQVESKFVRARLSEGLGDFRTAVALYAEILATCKSMSSDVTEKRARMAMARPMCLAGNAAVVEPFLESINHDPEVDSWQRDFDMGTCYALLGKYPKAINEFTWCLGKRPKADRGVNCCLALGQIYLDMGDVQRAEQAFDEASTYEKSLNSPEARWKWQFGKARARYHQKDAAGTAQWVKSALEVIESQRASIADYHARRSIQDNKYAVYDLAVTLALNDSKPDDAFLLAERSRARSFLDALEQSGDAVKATELATAASVQTACGANNVVIFLQQQTGIIAWILSKERCDVVKIECSEAQLSDAIGKAYRAMSARPADAWKTALGELYERIWKPIDAKLKPGSRVCVIPHRLLHYIPFQALYDGQHFLVENREIFYAPSGSSLVELKRRAGNAAQDIVLFDSILSADANSPFSKTETAALQKLFPTASTFIREKATVNSLRQNVARAGLVHISSHGSFDRWLPVRSGLHLTAEPGNDGVFRAEDVYRLSLKGSPLIVMSACVSSVGDLAGGDEVTGLTRAFQVAGAQNVIGSLWPVDNAATTQLMTYFYEELLKNKNEPAAALCAAQRRYLKTDPLPSHWAAFEVSGTGNQK